ncbi:glycine betaine/L-proline ABC transporter ATP-binding protein [Streptomyces sp. NPDC004609]|uniref:quaternary amine ABC transporter ATP-binding protein n=1 Tax=Streptomyces sp. NPDC004609 TaxID=3364704 RepID=UPI0036A82CAD
MSRLQVEHLYKVFGRRPGDAVRRLENGADRDELRADGTTAAVIDASFTVEPGRTFVVMGLSGSGKSTLLRMLNGLLPPTSGRVLHDGRDLTALSPRELRAVRSTKISMVFQHFALFPHRSVLENAGYGLEVQGVDRPERDRRAAEALALTGLAGWEDSWPDELSGGMQQRVGLARALATDADLLLMDESFSALDPLIRRDMQDQLLELQKTLKKTIVFITHDLNEAMRLGDRIAVMRDGRIVQTGTAEDILVNPANDYVASFTQDVDRSRVLTAGAIMSDPRTAYGTGSDGGDELRTPEDILAATPAVVRAGTPVTELFTPCSASGVAVAVTDDDGGLIGVVTRSRLLAVLGESARPTAPAGTAAPAAGTAPAGGEAPGDSTGAPGAGPVGGTAPDGGSRSAGAARTGSPGTASPVRTGPENPGAARAGSPGAASPGAGSSGVGTAKAVAGA